MSRFQPHYRPNFNSLDFSGDKAFIKKLITSSKPSHGHEGRWNAQKVLAYLNQVNNELNEVPKEPEVKTQVVSQVQTQVSKPTHVYNYAKETPKQTETTQEIVDRIKAKYAQQQTTTQYVIQNAQNQMKKYEYYTPVPNVVDHGKLDYNAQIKPKQIYTNVQYQVQQTPQIVRRAERRKVFYGPVYKIVNGKRIIV